MSAAARGARAALADVPMRAFTEPRAAQGSFEVSVSPEAAVVGHGGSVWINCSTTCRDPGARGGIETSLTKTPNSENGSRWAAFRLIKITEWASTLKCFFMCDGDMKVAAPFSSTRVYGIQLTDLRVLPPLAPGAPERVVLEPLLEMELGQAYNVTCWVLNVAPVTHLTVTLRWGGQTLHTETFQNHTGTGPDNITVITEITPQRRDHGQEIIERHGHCPGRGSVPVPGTAPAELHRVRGARVQIHRAERSHLP
ncbi:intercellular adhesion molecule 4-like [Emys orbicularis]|uniref:intercellular adhesion molecule 4-like n=1 Tax=Emys orbicularis TaxID=82168 RepID=UPI0031FDD32D